MSDSSLRTVSVVEALAASLRDRVLDGQLGAGSSVAETDVADWYEVSRPTAKSAIAVLVAQGLLRREANRPARVPRLSPADIEDLFLVRIPLEKDVLRHLLSRRSVPVVKLRTAVTDLLAVPADAPHSQFVEPDLRFHSILVDAVVSPHLSALFASIRGEIHLGMAQTRSALGRDRIAAEHAAVLDALVAADRQQALELMSRHLSGACAALTATPTAALPRTEPHHVLRHDRQYSATEMT